MAFAPDGRLFIAEQTGALRIVQNGVLLPTPFVTLPVDSNGERGLLGVAFPPDFATSHRVYVYFTMPTPSSHNVVAWFGGADGNTASTGPNIVVTLPNLSTATNHNGGAIHFSPSDGQLYIAVGENANGANSQNLTTPLGKMLRVTEDGVPSAGNPTFGGAPHDARVWAWGLRNPFTFAFDTGGTLFINDVGSGGSGACGSGTWEEINLGAPGANYGWPIVEGPPITPQCTNPAFTPPITSYSHTDPSNPCAIAGGTFYQPSNPLLGQQFVGDYFFSDLCGGWIRYRRPDGSVDQLASNINSPVDLHTGPDGSLWYLAHSGSVGRIAQPTAPWQVFLRNSPSSGAANISTAYGIRGDDVLFCDWDGNGTDTIGVDRGNMWFLNNANDSSPPEAVFAYGNVGDTPVCGDWDGNGTDTVGVRRGNTFYLRNSNTTGVADVAPVVYGNPGDIPVVGHWTGGAEGIGVRRGNTFFLRNSLTSGVADITAVYGEPSDQPIVGDWDGNGTDTIGVHRGFTFFLRNSDTSGVADITSPFGNIGDLPVAGNFDGIGGDGIGVLR
jgi:glucose/arabinose dehydrogenase